jgi:hypothetical protein
MQRDRVMDRLSNDLASTSHQAELALLSHRAH